MNVEKTMNKKEISQLYQREYMEYTNTPELDQGRKSDVEYTKNVRKERKKIYVSSIHDSRTEREKKIKRRKKE